MYCSAGHTLLLILQLILLHRYILGIRALIQNSHGCHQLPETIQFASQTVQLCVKSENSHYCLVERELCFELNLKAHASLMQCNEYSVECTADREREV